MRGHCSKDDIEEFSRKYNIELTCDLEVVEDAPTSRKRSWQWKSSSKNCPPSHTTIKKSICWYPPSTTVSLWAKEWCMLGG